MARRYSYPELLAAAERVHWRVEDLIGGDRRLDFGKPFLPESLAGVETLTFLSAAERRMLNQIRGHGYLCTFALAEGFILPFVLDHARPQLGGESSQVRGLLHFACEEAKHIDLFERFRAAFAAGFGSPCEVIGPAREIGRAVLSHHPLGVALAILQIEWMTQRHYLDSVRGGEGLDPQFCSLLEHHWMEEAQHARMDTLVVQSLAASCHPEEIETAIDEYLAIVELLDRGFREQVGLDLQALQRASGRLLGAAERRAFLDAQMRATRWTFLGSGMTHPNFLDTAGALVPAARDRIAAVASGLC